MKSFSSRLSLQQPGDRKSVTELTAVLSVCLSSGCCRFLSSGRIKPSLVSVQKNTSIWETPRNKTPFERCSFEAPFRGVFHTSARLGLRTTKRPRPRPRPRGALASEHATGRRRRGGWGVGGGGGSKKAADARSADGVIGQISARAGRWASLLLQQQRLMLMLTPCAGLWPHGLEALACFQTSAASLLGCFRVVQPDRRAVALRTVARIS